jgi:hypothetical protein
MGNRFGWRSGTVKCKTVIGGISAITAGATPKVDFGKSLVYTLTPAEDETITASGGVPGQEAYLVVTTSGATSRTLTFSTGFKTTATLVTGTVTAKVFTMHFIRDASNWNEVSRTTAM